MAIDECPPDKIYGINVEKIKMESPISAAAKQLERAMSLNNFEPYKGQLIEPPRPLGDIFGITHNKKEENNKVTEPKPYTKKEKALLDAFFATEKRNERAGKAYQEACREKDEAQKALNDARIRAVNGLRFPEEDVKLIRISKNKVAIISYNNVVVREVFEQPKED